MEDLNQKASRVVTSKWHQKPQFGLRLQNKLIYSTKKPWNSSVKIDSYSTGPVGDLKKSATTQKSPSCQSLPAQTPLRPWSTGLSCRTRTLVTVPNPRIQMRTAEPLDDAATTAKSLTELPVEDIRLSPTKVIASARLPSKSPDEELTSFGDLQVSPDAIPKAVPARVQLETLIAKLLQWSMNLRNSLEDVLQTQGTPELASLLYNTTQQHLNQLQVIINRCLSTYQKTASTDVYVRSPRVTEYSPFNTLASRQIVYVEPRDNIHMLADALRAPSQPSKPHEHGLLDRNAPYVVRHMAAAATAAHSSKVLNTQTNTMPRVLHRSMFSGPPKPILPCPSAELQKLKLLARFQPQGQKNWATEHQGDFIGLEYPLRSPSIPRTESSTSISRAQSNSPLVPMESSQAESFNCNNQSSCTESTIRHNILRRHRNGFQAGYYDPIKVSPTGWSKVHPTTVLLSSQPRNTPKIYSELVSRNLFSGRAVAYIPRHPRDRIMASAQVRLVTEAKICLMRIRLQMVVQMIDLIEHTNAINVAVTTPNRIAIILFNLLALIPVGVKFNKKNVFQTEQKRSLTPLSMSANSDYEQPGVLVKATLLRASKYTTDLSSATARGDAASPTLCSHDNQDCGSQSSLSYLPAPPSPQDLTDFLQKLVPDETQSFIAPETPIQSTDSYRTSAPYLLWRCSKVKSSK